MSASTLDRADSTPEHGDPAGPGRDHYRPALVALLAATAAATAAAPPWSSA